jgi:fatty acid desaturase
VGVGPPTLAEMGTQLAGRWEARRRNRVRRSWSRYLSVVAVCWAIWGVTVITSTGHNLEAVWPLWVTLPWGAILVRRPHLRQHGC